jgi:DNA-binding XRE family transcriptional regulator
MGALRQGRGIVADRRGGRQARTVVSITSNYYIDNIAFICHDHAMSGYRSKSARSTAALCARLFGSASEQSMARHREDWQICIRAGLRRRRRTLGLSQEDAARMLGVHRLTYHRIENGPRRIRPAELVALSDVFHCPVAELAQDGALADAFVRVVGIAHAPSLRI